MNHTYSTPEPLSERDAAWFEELAGTLERGRAALRARQSADGHWVGAVESLDPLQAELILLFAFLGRTSDERVGLAANALRGRQQPDGTWGDLGASVRAYLALKLAGDAAGAPHLARAADAIRARGGAGAADPLTRAYLALLGQLPYPACGLPAVQSVLLPKWLGGIGSHPEWERANRVALGIFAAYQPVAKLPEAMGVSELFGGGKAGPAHGRRPFRARAVRAAANWLRARYAEDGPDANARTLMLTAAALRGLGVPDADPEARWVLAQLDRLCDADGDSLRVRPFRAPVRDTALALVALTDAAAGRAGPEHAEAARWLLAADAPRDAETAALALTALGRGGHVMCVASSDAVYRTIRELVANQNRDGGWGAFDRGVGGDPSCPGLTGCVLEALGQFGFRVGQPPVDAAVRFILSAQLFSGEWRNRWDADSLRTVCQVFAGLHAVGFDVYGLPVRRAVRWLKEAQHADAGWGGVTETAWAVLALLTAGESESPEVRAGVEFLAGTQRADGTWPEKGFPLAGFASETRLRYELDATCLALSAVGRFVTGHGQPVEVRKTFARRDAGHAARGPTSFRHTLAEM